MEIRSGLAAGALVKRFRESFEIGAAVGEGIADGRGRRHLALSCAFRRGSGGPHSKKPRRAASKPPLSPSRGGASGGDGSGGPPFRLNLAILQPVDPIR